MSPVLQDVYHLGFTLAHDVTNRILCADLIAAGLICISSVQTLQGSPALSGNVGVLFGVF